MTKLRVGLVGLGEVAQLIHLPILNRLHHLFEITALCDVSPSVLANVAARWKVDRRHTSLAAMVDDDNVDAVFVLSPDQHHFEHATAALKGGKHVFIEKPACLTRTHVEQLEQIVRQAGRVAMVGYMRRFAPAFLEAKRRLDKLDELSYVRVQDLFCEGPWYFHQTGDVEYPSGDIPTAVAAASQKLRQEMMMSVSGVSASPARLLAYEYLTGVSSHSISAMRDLLGGAPRSVTGAQMSPRGNQLTVTFDYGDYGVVYEYLIDDLARFDAGIDLYTRRQLIRLRYATPYMRDQAMKLEIQESTDNSNAWTVLGPFHKDPFDAELEAFHASIVNGAENRTPLSDSLADFHIFEEIMAKLTSVGSTI